MQAFPGSARSLATATAIDVSIVDGAGAQITTFGGGTQYTEGDVDASITGTAAMWEDTGNVVRTVSASTPLPVNIISGAGSGGTAMTDDSAFTVGSTNVTPSAGTYRATRDSVDDGDAGALAMTAKRGLYATIETPNGDSVMDDTLDYLKVGIMDGAGAQITTFGGGTQYTEGDTDASITGTAMLMEGAANTLLTVPGTTADGLLVNLGANNDVSISGTVAVTGGLTDAELRATAVPVSGTFYQATQPVSAATLPLPTGASTSANQTTLIGHVDGIEGLLTTIDADTSALAAVDYATGADVASLAVTGGGTEASAVRVTIASDSTGVVSVDDNGGSITVDGTVAATQSGTWTEANSAAIAASLSVIDDWDETNRAAVNVISGQVGVAGGSGVVGAAVQRVVLATDVGLPAGTSALGKVGHDITGIGHGVTTVATAGTDVALAGSTACKRVVIQAQTDNTAGIAVGGSGVDATIATGTGIFLNPGDAFELEISNLADVFIDSLTNGEGVRYTYFT